MLSADRIFLESLLLKERFLQFHPNAAEKIALSPAPVDTTRFRWSSAVRCSERFKLSIPESTKLLLAVGRLDRNKNFLTLIHAVSLLKNRECLLLIVGVGSEKLELQKQAKLAGVGDRVRFIDSYSGMERLYAAADVFAHPALLEAYGYVILEAMASGLPCIVSPAANVGLSRDLTDGVNAFFADPRAPWDWADKIARLLDDATLSANLGEGARRFCEHRSGWPNLTSRLLEEGRAASFECSG
jgi:glycosyltransferase involved in cell wall biosynthesis